MKFDTYSRFAFIETRLYWGEGLTAQELADAFGLTRQTAQGVIDVYRRLHPGAIVFDASYKRQVAGADFHPGYIRSSAGEFLDYLRGQAMIAYYKEAEDWSGLPFHDVDRLLRPCLQRGPIRQVLSALNAQRAITIYYQSKRSAQMRDFSPNQLIFAGNRYHVRGYCHSMQTFLDFVPSRIIQVEPSTTEWVSSLEDKDWNMYVDLYFKPNAQLPAEVQQALRYGFPLNEQGTFTIHCRRALAFYVKRELLTIDSRHDTPLWVQICENVV